ncbi:MAG: hypothetical protein KKF93_06715 [Candidatus Omnitrophica bacterium]|nr:hypothetical protein [Candidatus Omnitrophota bacterium]
MKTKSKFWAKKKAERHLKIAGWILIVSGILTMFFACKRFIDLGLSAFIIPYVFNILDFFFGLFEIYVAYALLNLKSWSRLFVYIIVATKIIFDYFLDPGEFYLMLIALVYFIWIFRYARIGWLFKKSAMLEGNLDN